MDTSRAELLFYEALDLPEAEREAFVEEHCARQPELSQELRSLLAAHTGAGEFLREGPSLEAIAAMEGAEDPTVGSLVGTFRVEKFLAAGGMGSVYLAHREGGEFSQTVAIKLIRRGLYDEDARRRFHNECRILATLEHPHIARLIDGGLTEEGVPYIAMEYVDGRPIDEYCDSNKLSLTARIDLFRKVCDAVQHAHRNSTIHRDIKPANILVDQTGSPKLVDFGIARVLDAAANTMIDRTATVAQALTPQYASPEQLRGEFLTTVSDVYSLGVVLYKLLTGHTPYPDAGVSALQMVQALETSHPSVPSEVTATRALRGDLDTIMLMALRKEPERRYSSPDSLSEDLLRYLRGRPVLAQPDTIGYRTRKFVQRNALATAFSVVLIVVLVTAAVGGLVLSKRAYDSEQRAVASRDLALQEQGAAEEVSGFLQDLLGAASPLSVDGAPDATIREALDLASRQLDEGPALIPRTEAALRYTIGMAYFSLGLYDESEGYLERAHKIRRRPELRSTGAAVSSLVSIGNLRWKQDRMEEADRWLHRAVTLADSLAGSPAGVDAAILCEAELSLSRVLSETNQRDEAELMARRALASASEVTTERSSLRAQAANELGICFYYQGRYEEGESQFHEAIKIARTDLGGHHAYVGECLNNLGNLLGVAGRHTESIEVLEEALRVDRIAYPAGHPEITMTRLNLADAVAANNEYDEAIEIYREVRGEFIEFYGAEHFNVGMAANNYAYAAMLKGDLEAARPLFEEAVKIFEASLGPDHPGVATGQANLARIYRRLGMMDDAERMGQKALATTRRALPAGHHFIARPLSTLAELRMDRRDFEGAEPLLVEARELVHEGLPEESKERAEFELLWARCLDGLDRQPEAVAVLEQTLSSVGGEYSDTRSRTIQALVDLYTGWDQADSALVWKERGERG